MPFHSLLLTQLLLDCKTSNVKLREPVSERRLLVAGNRIFSGNCNRRQSYSLHVCSDGHTPVVVSKGIIGEILKVDLRSGFSHLEFFIYIFVISCMSGMPCEMIRL